MSELASGVCLLTLAAADPTHELGMTVTSLASASLRPPMVTVGVGRATSLAPYLHPGVEAGLSVLGVHQQDLATDFSRSGRPPAPQILAHHRHRRGPVTGALLAEGALAQLEGRVAQTIATGDHVLVVIEVLAAHVPPEVEAALLYHRRGYTRPMP